MERRLGSGGHLLSLRRQEWEFKRLYRGSQWRYLRSSVVARLPGRLQCDMTFMGNEVVARDDQAARDGFVEVSVRHGN